jgi:Flp pilus assembly protein TadG
MTRMRRFLRDEKGATMIMVAISTVMIFGFAVIAIDLSLIQLAKTQLQNAADAAALAGAMAQAIGGNDATVKAEAIRIAGLNVAVQDTQRTVVIFDRDVDFPNCVRVKTYRTEAHGDPVSLYFLKVMNPLLGNKGDVKAEARARFLPVCATDCFRPWCVPDRWSDTNGDGIWEPGESYDPLTTGYQVSRDIGVQVTLRLNEPDASPRMGWYYPVSFPGYSGANDYKNWIAGCVDPSLTIHLGDQLDIEPGAMVGPTHQGLEALMAMDLDAQWDPVTKTVINSAYLTSPRIIKVAAFDPTLGVLHHPGGPGYVTVSNILVLFVEGYLGGDIVGRFMRLATQGSSGPNCPGGVSGGFAVKVALVRN